MVAQRLKRADAGSAGAAREGFLAYWESDGQAHFREEEDILLPACAGVIDPETRVVAKVLTDHVRIRHLAGVVAGSEQPPLETLHELGAQLNDHVRREERELFPLIEASLPESELVRLVGLLSH